MTLQPFPGFKHFTTHHCVTGSLRHIYEFHDHPISEEMLLGLGSGVGFIYWHPKNSAPFLGGRANAGRPGEEGMEKAAGRCTGVQIELHHTSSAAKAEKTLLELLDGKQPVMLALDMGFLPYFDFQGQEYHFGGHVVVVCCLDIPNRQVLIADRDKPLHVVSLESLAKARGSQYQPFPPHNAWYTFDFSQKRAPQSVEVWQAIRQCAQGMLEPPIANLGIRGIYKAAQCIVEWPKLMDETALRLACFNAAIMIDARGGTGGGLFRTMYGHFLDEAVEITGEPKLREVAKQFLAVGECWDEVAGLLDRCYQAEKPQELLIEASQRLPEIAAIEEPAWRELVTLTQG
ncbi:MAG: BtrH N-terminal domain-containing protein [Anaerolineaceae bacterium]|jgi:hypothetical protein